MSEGISLGWNCHSATKGVEIGLRKRKQDGYSTCPFDECITNYDGIIQCIKEDFKYFCDSDYLELIEAPFSSGGTVKGEKLVYNTRYRFIFNHESPGHGNLYITQNWKNGINHYIDDDYKLFKERYNRRINNFRHYVQNNDITFIITRFQNNITELRNAIKETYPTLKFNIVILFPEASKTLVKEHHQYMRLTDDLIKYEINESI